MTFVVGSTIGAVLDAFSFFFNDTATTEIYTLSLHDALPICQQGPHSALSRTVVRTAVGGLAVAVPVVAQPAGALGQVALEDRVDDFEGIDDQRVVGAADAVTNELEETGVDDFAGLEFKASAGRPVAEVDGLGAGSLVGDGMAIFGRPDAHVVAFHFGKKDAVVGDGPVFEMEFDPVGVLLEELSEFERLVIARDFSGADEPADDGGEGGGGIAGVFFPAFLVGDGRILDQKASGPLDEGKDVPVAEAAGFPDAPGEDEREGYFVELYAGPVGSAVDPEVLGEAAIGTLGAGEIHQSAASGVDAAAGQQRRGGL